MGREIRYSVCRDVTSFCAICSLVHRNPLFLVILSQTNPCNALSSCSFNTHISYYLSYTQNLRAGCGTLV